MSFKFGNMIGMTLVLALLATTLASLTEGNRALRNRAQSAAVRLTTIEPISGS
jgi:hypothetical protein